MTLNLTALQNINGFYDAGQIAMSLTSNLFFVVIILMIYIVTLWKMIPKYDIASACASASFICLALSFPLVYLQWINIFFPIFLIIATAGSLFMIKMNS